MRKKHAEEIIEENAAHEGAPRTESLARPQESWEEFKEKANAPFEKALDHVTGTDAAGRLRSAARRAADIGRKNRTALLVAAGIGAALIAALLMSRRRPAEPELPAN